MIPSFFLAALHISTIEVGVSVKGAHLRFLLGSMMKQGCCSKCKAQMLQSLRPDFDNGAADLGG